MSILIIQILNSLFYAAVFFLIAAGFSLLYGFLALDNLAHALRSSSGLFPLARGHRIPPRTAIDRIPRSRIRNATA